MPSPPAPRQMLQELGDLKNKTRQTIQPLSHSQLQPEGWSGIEVDAFFNALYEHPMEMNGLASVIRTKSPQQVRDTSSSFPTLPCGQSLPCLKRTLLAGTDKRGVVK